MSLVNTPRLVLLIICSLLINIGEISYLATAQVVVWDCLILWVSPGSWLVLISHQGFISNISILLSILSRLGELVISHRSYTLFSTTGGCLSGLKIYH